MKYCKNSKSKNAFSLIEILVATTIIVILASMMLSNIKGGQKQLTLKRSANKIAQDIRRAQEMAMSAKEFNGSVPTGGYGLYFDKVQLGDITYLIFADVNGNKSYDSGEELERISLEKGIKLNTFYMGTSEYTSAYFAFVPPDPQTCINSCTSDSAKIIISITDNPAQTKTIKLNKAGLIEIQ